MLLQTKKCYFEASPNSSIQIQIFLSEKKNMKEEKMNVSTNPYLSLSDEELKNMCGVLQEKDSCLCAGKKSTHAWYTQSVNNKDHHGPGCEDTITYGDGEECLLATMCQNKFPEIQLPLCLEGNACMYPLWVGEGSGLEVLQDPDKFACDDWSCVNDEIVKPDRWHTGQNAGEHIKQWKAYSEKLKNRGTTPPSSPSRTKKAEFTPLVADSEHDLCVKDEFSMFEKYVFKIPAMSTDGTPGIIDVRVPQCANSKTSEMNTCGTYDCPIAGGSQKLTIKTNDKCPTLTEFVTNEGVCILE